MNTTRKDVGFNQALLDKIGKKATAQSGTFTPAVWNKIQAIEQACAKALKLIEEHVQQHKGFDVHITTNMTMTDPLAPEPAEPTEHPSVAWWAACPWITERPPTEADADDLGRVLVMAGDDFTTGFRDFPTGFRAHLWSYAASFCGNGWIHAPHWRPPYPQPPTLGQRIDAELAVNAELSPELRAILIEAKSVVGEVVK